MSADVKACSKCKCQKSIQEFSRNKSRPDGLACQCKKCAKQYDAINRDARIAYLREYQEKNKEVLREKQRVYQVKNKEVMNAKSSAYYLANKDKCNEAKKVWRDNNLEHCKERDKAYYDANRLRILEQKKEYAAKTVGLKSDYNKSYRVENWDRLRNNHTAYVKSRRATDSVFDISMRVRGLISVKIRTSGYTKKSKAQTILGCNWEFFKLHIEKQFSSGMSWENRKDWHIDHIMPMATASTEEDVIRLNHYSNLRPMWAKDNLSKGAQIMHLI